MLILATGGTIDKLPVTLPDGTFDNDSREFGETHLPAMLEQARYWGKHTIRTLFMLDSLEMTDEHRARIAAAAYGSRINEQIVITHGTDTMPETARYLSRDRGLGSKTIVLTGSMIPFSMGGTSDAMFNVGSALAYAQSLEPGVYVAMNGQVFDADNVQKNKAEGVFEPIR